MTEAERLDTEQDRRRAMFCGRLSHQLASPLNVILNGAEYIQTSLEKGSPAQQQEAIALSAQAIRDSAHCLDRLAQNLLDLLAVFSDSFRPAIHPVELAGQLDVLLGLTRDYAQRQGVALHWHREQMPPQAFVLADEALVDRIVLNLISNSILYGRPGGNVWVELAGENGGYCVTVRDDGPGITPEEASALRGPFRELPPQALQKSSGIGLYLCTEFCKAMGWSLELAGSGEGTTACIHAPAGRLTGTGPDLNQISMASGELMRQVRRQEQAGRVAREMEPLLRQSRI